MQQHYQRVRLLSLVGFLLWLWPAAGYAQGTTAAQIVNALRRFQTTANTFTGQQTFKDPLYTGAEPTPSAPGAALLTDGSGNCTAGAHLFKVVAITATGKTAASAASGSVTCDGSHTKVTITLPYGTVYNVGVGGFSFVTGFDVYATKAGGATYFLIAASPTISDASLATYTFSIADGSFTATTPEPSTNTTNDSRVNLLQRVTIGTGDDVAGTYGLAINAALPIETHSPYALSWLGFNHAAQGFRAPTIALYKSRGTKDAPTAVQSGDNTGYITFGGYNTASGYIGGAQIIGLARETFTSAQHSGTTLQFCVNDASGGGIACATTLLKNTGTGDLFTTDNLNATTSYKLNGNAFGSATIGPSSPVGTTSTTLVMAGLAGSITTRTGRINLCMSGVLQDGTANDGSKVQISYGTGTAPVNGAALTGTQVGPIQSYNAATLAAAAQAPYGACWPVTGLTGGTAYWFDTAFAAITGGTATITQASMTAFDIP